MSCRRCLSRSAVVLGTSVTGVKSNAWFLVDSGYTPPPLDTGHQTGEPNGQGRPFPQDESAHRAGQEEGPRQAPEEGRAARR